MKEFHWFVSHGLGFKTGATLEEALDGAFCTSYFGDMKTWIRNIQKGGEAGIPCFCCKVLLPVDAKYSIEWFVPQLDAELMVERQNRIVTYVTLKKLASMRDPADKIRELNHQIEKLDEDEANTRLGLFEELAALNATSAE